MLLFLIVFNSSPFSQVRTYTNKPTFQPSPHQNDTKSHLSFKLPQTYSLHDPTSIPSPLLSESVSRLLPALILIASLLCCPATHLSENVSLRYNKFIVQLQGMSICQVLMSKCELCSGQKCELRLVFRQLHKKLKRILGSATFGGQLKEDSWQEMEGFAQLMRVINIQNRHRDRKWTECKHSRFFKSLQKSLNCNFTTLNYLCEITANQLAQKNYAIALLEAQFKNISEKVAILTLASPEVVKVEEPRIASLSSLPSEREIQGGSGNCVMMLGSSQTSIEEIGLEYMNSGFNYYCQFPFFYGKPA